MRIGLSMRVVQAPAYPETRDAVSHDWIRRLEGWSMTPVLIPNALDRPQDFLDAAKLDLLVLTGGDDFGQTPDRDQTEQAILDRAIEVELPVLGICRGMQLINNRSGGRTAPMQGHAATSHVVRFEGPWQALYGRDATVNSYHDQGVEIDGLASEFTAWAFDADGHVEGFSHTDRAVAGVMWHPERGGAPEGDRELMIKLARNGAFWS